MFNLFGKKKVPYARIAVVIMHHAERAAVDCTDAGTKTRKQFNASFLEFLAYMTAFAGQKLCSDPKTTEAEVKECFDSLIAGFADTDEPTRSNVEVEVRMIACEMVLNEKIWRFRDYVKAYCIGDLDTLRVTKSDLAELEEKTIDTNQKAAGSFAFLVRISKLSDDNYKIPSGVAVLGYHQIIWKAIGRFRAELDTVVD